MTQYTIVVRDSLFDLEVIVNAMLAEGAKPQGGVAVTTFFDAERYPVNTFYQAMIKEVSK